MAVNLQSILQLLGSSGGALPGFDQDYAMQSEMAYQNLAEALANLDRQEVETGTEYERQRAEAGYNQKDATTSLLSALANRGTLKSGITTRALQNQGRQYTNILDALANARQSNLSNIAGQRISAQGGYNQTMAGLNSALAGKSADYIQNFVNAEAQRQTNLQQQQMNEAMLGQQRTLNEQMLAQINKPSTDYSSLLQSLSAQGASQPSAPSQPTQPTNASQPTSTSAPLPIIKPKPSVYSGSTTRIIKPIGSANRAV